MSNSKDPAYLKNWKDSLKNVRKFVKNRIAWIQDLSSTGHYYYGENDSLPNEVVEALNNSGTATACLNRIIQFTKAEGFVDEYTAIKKVNGHQTFNDLLDEIVENESKLQGFALRLFFDNEGYISHIKNVPIPWVRRDKKGHFVINRLMGEYGRNKSEDLLIREFDPTIKMEERVKIIREETLKNKGKQKGELFYCFRPKLGRNYDVYPVPDYYSGIDDIISDGKISRLELRNIMQGWRTPIVISTGPIDNVNPITDENGEDTGKTQLDVFNEGIEDFLGEDAAPVLHLMGRTNEEKPVITTIDIKTIVDMTEKATLRLGEKVARLLGVPKVLIGFSQAGQLGNVQEIKNMIDLFYNSIINRQNYIKAKLDALKPLMREEKALDFEIGKLNALTLIPDAVFNRLSDAEIREIFELPQIETEKSLDIENTKQVNDTLTNLTGRQLQNVQRIIRKFKKEEITEAQASLMLKEGFGFNEEQCKTWLNTEENGEDNTI